MTDAKLMSEEQVDEIKERVRDNDGGEEAYDDIRLLLAHAEGLEKQLLVKGLQEQRDIDVHYKKVAAENRAYKEHHIVLERDNAVLRDRVRTDEGGGGK